jgi:fatty-acyl-CoA synthase/long-chain acyl-CoA synthetase
MAGYHDRPEATAKALQNGWLHTGDLGYLDKDRYLYLVDRKNDVIITGGMNVYSAEIEQFLENCPGVRQVAVVGMPDPDWGEAVAAFLVAGADGVDEELLIRRCRAELAAYKRPKRIVTVAELPTTAVGKVDKKRLRREYSS